VKKLTRRRDGPAWRPQVRVTIGRAGDRIGSPPTRMPIFSDPLTEWRSEAG